MTVAELIEELKKQDPDEEIRSCGPDSGGYDWEYGEPVLSFTSIDGEKPVLTIWHGRNFKAANEAVRSLKKT